MTAFTLASEFEDFIPIVAIAAGSAIAVIWIIMATIDSTVKTRAREATRRELAAYVAEGSMSATDAAQIMNAGKNAKAAGATPSEFRV
jgi:hypothetical protein